MNDKEKLISVLRNYTLPEFTESIIAAIKPSVRLKTIPNKQISLGDTKFGGTPHLPKTVNWPINPRSKNPYSFLLQINLKDIHLFTNSLPKSGMLFFFINVDDPNEGKVIYSNDMNLSIIPIPEILQKESQTIFQRLFKLSGTKRYIIKEVGVEINAQYHPPSDATLYMNSIIKKHYPNAAFNKFSVYDQEIYESALFYNSDEDSTISNHHLLGYQHIIQGGFHEEHIMNPKTKLQNLTFENIEEILKWQLLFQCDSDKNLNLSWGDGGMVYFFIHEEDLTTYSFDKVKVTWDCY